jgi:hypothetical protein
MSCILKSLLSSLLPKQHKEVNQGMVEKGQTQTGALKASSDVVTYGNTECHCLPP